MDDFVELVFEWGKDKFRPFPWRMKRKPYKIFVAEFLLQKTDSEKVMSVYDLVINKYPNPKALSKARSTELAQCIKRLGLSYRSERMIGAAKTIVTRFQGNIPCSQNMLLNIKGIGRYMANAILCFGFGYCVPLIDTNIARILQRYWGIQSSISRPREDRYLWDFAGELVPKNEAPNYNYSLLDLGALICHARLPECKKCPLLENCKAGSADVKAGHPWQGVGPR